MVEQDKLKHWQGSLVDILSDISSLNKKMKRLSNNSDGHINSRQKETIRSLHRMWKKKIAPFQISLKTLYCLSERHYVDATSLSKICGTDLSESSDALYLSGGNIQEAIDLLNTPKTKSQTKSTPSVKVKKENVKMEIKKEKVEPNSRKKKRKLVRKSNTMRELMTSGRDEDSDSGSDSEWRPTSDGDNESNESNESDESDDSVGLESDASSQGGESDESDSDAMDQNDEYEDDDFIVEDDESLDDGSGGDSSDEDLAKPSQKTEKELDIDTEGSVVIVTPKKKKPVICTIEDSSDDELDKSVVTVQSKDDTSGSSDKKDKKDEKDTTKKSNSSITKSDETLGSKKSETSQEKE